MKTSTKFLDTFNQKICVGDLLQNEDGYMVIVAQYDNDGGFYGKLVTHDNSSCKNINYSLNKGIGHAIINKKSLVFQYRAKTFANDFIIEKDRLVIRDEDYEKPIIYNFEEFNVKLYIKKDLTICKIYLNL